jgi:hypothetical protein
MAIQSNFPAIKPTLLLDFANTKQLDPRVTFIRASTGTFYGTQTAKAEENLLLQSQAWATTPWFNNTQGSTNVVTNNSAAAPDGTTTATSITYSTQFASRAQPATTIAGLNYTFSFWARQVSGNTALHIVHSNSATGADTAITITSTWARYSVTVLGRTGGGTVEFGLQDKNASGFGEVLVWGAQLEQRSAVTAYTVTTTQPITNYIPQLLTAASGVARFDHNPTTFESLGLEIEEQRTNLLTYSEQFDDAVWTKAQSSITANTIVSPAGTLTGDKLVENTATADHAFRGDGTISAGATISFSIYAKLGERSNIRLQFADTASTNQTLAFFNLSDGTTSGLSQTGASTLGASSITAVGNGWYRCVLIGRIDGSATTARCRVSLSDTSNNISYTGNGFNGLFIWGAQLEAGAFPTSYIQTVASQVTRAADSASMTGTNFSSWYNQAEGTMFASGNGARGQFPMVFGITETTANINNQVSTFIFNGVTPTSDVWSGGVSQASLPQTNAVSLGGAFALSVAVKTNDFALSAQGLPVSGDTSGTLPGSFTRLDIGARNTVLQLNGTIRKIAYYPLRVTNANLIALTS